MLSQLPVSNTDVGTASVLGHSYSSIFKGVTASYKGATKIDLWTKQMEIAITDPIACRPPVYHTNREEYCCMQTLPA